MTTVEVADGTRVRLPLFLFSPPDESKPAGLVCLATLLGHAKGQVLLRDHILGRLARTANVAGAHS